MRESEYVLIHIPSRLTHAEMLNVSRPYVIKLLELKKIPFTKVGSHRRIRFSDLMNYKRSRDIEREHALDEIAQMSQDLGMYD